MSFQGRAHSVVSNEKRSASIKALYESGNKNNMGFSTVHKTDEAKRRAALSRQLKHRYGITIEDYYEILENQLGACAICGNKFTYSLYVDHDHHTGKVRGLVCQPCNSVLGFAKDSPSLLVEAILYLSKNNSIGKYANDTLRKRLKESI